MSILKRDTAKRSRGYPPRRGFDYARTWAVAYGSAWVEASDLIGPGGPLMGRYKMHDILRCLARSNVPVEHRLIHRQRKLYRLHPDVVAELLYGGTK